jgi:hypothetical protein
MALTNYFNISRFWLLLKVELYRIRKGILMTCIITFGLLFTILILETLLSNEKVFTAHQVNYAIGLLAGGFIISSLSFSDLSHSLKRYNYLTLPASTLEKFLSMLILSCVCWLITFSLAYIAYTYAANSVGHLLFSNVIYMPFKLSGRTPTGAIKYYIVLQGLFLVGAVHFRGFVFPKTILSILIFGMICGIIFYLFMADLLKYDSEFLFKFKPLHGTPVYQIWHLIEWMFWWLLAPLCWITSYTALKEQEA